MMIEPPTGSPRPIEMALAASRITTRGLAKKPRNPISAAKRRSPARLFGPCWRRRRSASAEVSPAGVASEGRAVRLAARPKSGPVSCLVCSGCGLPPQARCMIHGSCQAPGLSRHSRQTVIGTLVGSNCPARCRFCTLHQRLRPPALRLACRCQCRETKRELPQLGGETATSMPQEGKEQCPL